MNNKFHVEISDVAEERLLEHAVFLAKVDIKDALFLTDKFASVAQSLTSNPERGSWVFESGLERYKYRKIHIHKWYWIYYQIFDDTVFIYTVRDTRQESPF